MASPWAHPVVLVTTFPQLSIIGRRITRSQSLLGYLERYPALSDLEARGEVVVEEDEVEAELRAH